MKRVSPIFSAVLILLVCTTTVKAQREINTSGENSNVILWNVWFDAQEQFGCTPETVIDFNVRVHIVVKQINGIQTVFYNVHGEGVDADGGVWTWIDTWKLAWDMTTWDMIYENDNHKIHGPKGVKEKLRVLFVINGNGEVVQNKLELWCD